MSNLDLLLSKTTFIYVNNIGKICYFCGLWTQPGENLVIPGLMRLYLLSSQPQPKKMTNCERCNE